MGRVRIGTCSGPADAALVRAAFSAHGIPILINAEHHASVLGGLGGAFVPLHIYVDDEHAEEAAALLSDLRGRDAPDPELPDEAGDEGDAAGGEVSDAASVDLALERRRRTAMAALLGLSVTFGTAHMSTGAWLRGLVIAGLQALAIAYLVAGDLSFGGGLALIVACVATDLIGGVWRAGAIEPRPRLPVARLRR